MTRLTWAIVAAALGLAGSTAGLAAQEAAPAGDAPSSGSSAGPRSPYAAPAPGDITPIIFAPSVTAPVTSGDIVRSLNTPSGLSPFLGSSAIPRGIQFFIDQTVKYDDNARRLTDGAAPIPGRSRGDFYSVTNVGGSASTNLGLQTLFVRGNYGLTRYRSNPDLNADLYSLSAGINWRLGSPCSGSFTVSTNQSELGLQDALLGTVGSLTKTERADFQGRCHIFNRFYATYGAGAQRFSVSSTPTNDYRQWSARGGLEYALPGSYTLGIETVYAKNNFINRVATALSPVTTDLDQQDYRLYYRYFVSPKTSLNFSAGRTTFKSSSPFSNNEKSVPTYSAGITWRPTPKILLMASGDYSAGPPQGIASDYQRSRLLTLSAIYTFSPKLSFTALYAYTKTTTAVFSSLTGSSTSQETTTNAASLDANYRINPYLFAGAGYRFSEQTDNLTGRSSRSNVYTINLSYRR